MDRGGWRATVHGVVESDMTKQLTQHPSNIYDTIRSFPFRSRVYCVTSLIFSQIFLFLS